MAVIELYPFDLFTNRPQRLYALQPFWSNLASLGARSARLLVVTDHINYDAALAGFQDVAVPFEDLPRDLRWYRSYYEQYLRSTIRETQFMRVFLIVSSVLDDTTLMRLIAGYGIRSAGLDRNGIPLPFDSAETTWDSAVDTNGQHWGVLQSDLNQTGAVLPQTLHKLFALDFPVYISIDIWNYTRSEAVQMLKTKAAVANVQSLSQKTGRSEKIAANESQLAIDDFKRLIGSAGIALHELRVSMAVGASNSAELKSRIELLRGSCPLELEKRRARISILQSMFSAAPPGPRQGTLATSIEVTMLAASALSYRRPTRTSGVLCGFDSQQSPLVISLFDPANSAYNAIIIGQTGAGKTFFTTLLMLRSLLTGARLIIIDPKGDIDLSWLGQDDHSRELCQRISVGRVGNSINVLEPTFPELSNQIEFAMGILRMLGVFDPNNGIERTILDNSLGSLYAACYADQPGTTDVPTMRHLRDEVLSIAANAASAIRPIAESLAFKLIPFATGSRSALFGQPTNVDLSLDAPVTVFDVSAFPSRQTSAAMRGTLFATLFGLVNQSIVSRRKRGDRAPIQFFIDEVGVMMRDPVVADYASDKYKTARSLGVAMIAADQTIQSLIGVADQYGTRHGHEMFANSPFRFVFFQEDSEMETLIRQFPMMPEAYRQQIHRLPRGQCIAQTPDGIFRLIVTASDLEHTVLSSNLQHKARARQLIGQMRRELREEQPDA